MYESYIGRQEHIGDRFGGTSGDEAFAGVR